MCKSLNVQLLNKNGLVLDCKYPIKKVRDLIIKGNIIAVKGLGGFHIACDGKNEKAIEKLRIRKNRPTKPLALMMRDINTVNKYCKLNKLERNILCSDEKPILLLNKRIESLPKNIAPNNDKLGVMLPYTNIHKELFCEDLEVLIMTSGNISGMPIFYKDEEAFNGLNNIVDYFVIHNEPIKISVDDSILRISLNEKRVIRMGRGYSPLTIDFNGKQGILACGSHFKNSIGISKDNKIIVSHHIGDLNNLETLNRFKYTVDYFKKTYNINSKLIAKDIHPQYGYFSYLEKENLIKIDVQHHHAHIVSCMFENNVQDKVIGIAYDGVGYGMDKNIWGGEFFICDYKNFERVGHLNYVEMPGGDGASREPWKMCISYMYKAYKENVYELIPKHFKGKNIDIILKMIKNNINCPKCSSMGRLFDAVSALLGYIYKITFEAEAAILLENMADEKEESSYSYNIEFTEKKYLINTDNIFKEILEDINNNLDKSIIAKKFHNTIINFSVEICLILREKYNINKTVLSGGVFQNEILLKGIYEKLKKYGFNVYTHKLLPCNDSGICVGQLVIASEILGGG